MTFGGSFPQSLPGGDRLNMDTLPLPYGMFRLLSPPFTFRMHSFIVPVHPPAFKLSSVPLQHSSTTIFKSAMERRSSRSSLATNLKQKRVVFPLPSFKPFRVAKKNLPDLNEANCDCSLLDTSFHHVESNGMRQEAASRANQSFTGYEADESMAVEEKMKKTNHRRTAKIEQTKYNIYCWLEKSVPEATTPLHAVKTHPKKRRSCYQSRKEKPTSYSSLPCFPIDMPSQSIESLSRVGATLRRAHRSSSIPIRPRMGVRALEIPRRKIYFL